MSQKKSKCKCRVCLKVLPGSQFSWGTKKNGKTYPDLICKECARWKKIEKKYGMTKEMWWDLWDQQKGKDPITLESLDERTCHVDHCHQTGRIRGLLNGSTNRGLGYLRDSQENLERAIDYIAGTSIQSNGPEGHAGEPCVSPEGTQ